MVVLKNGNLNKTVVILSVLAAVQLNQGERQLDLKLGYVGAK
jgi:hypothetical protein